MDMSGPSPGPGPYRDLDLVLEYRKRNGDFDEVILASIPGLKYTFGSEYPGDREGEEFVFSRVESDRVVIHPIHCAITVDEKGEFRIQNESSNDEKRATRSSASSTFVNSERVMGVDQRVLRVGDVISLGAPGKCWTGPASRRHPVYVVKERIFPIRDCQIHQEAEKKDENGTENELITAEAESPFDNHLILSKILSYLPVGDLKNARQVSKKWGNEASRILEKKAIVSFSFSRVDYINPKHSTKVCRFFHEMRALNIRNLQINLNPDPDVTNGSPLPPYQPDPFSPGEPGDKMLTDIQKLFNASSFSTLLLKANMEKEPDFTPFSLIFQQLGNFAELNFEGNLHYLPEQMPSFPLLTNLKKYTHQGTLSCLGKELKEHWASHIVPLFAKGLEDFSTCNYMVDHYLQQFLKEGTPNLKGVIVTGGIDEGTLVLLNQLKKPLTKLGIEYYKAASEDWNQFERLLFKNAKTLRSLTLTLGIMELKKTEIRFPSFPKLEELEIEYLSWITIFWGGGSDRTLEYKKDLPSLKKLAITPPIWSKEEIVGDPLFVAFFPQGDAGNAVMSETVMDLFVPVLPAQDCSCFEQDEKETFQRTEQIRRMFPNAINVEFCQKELPFLSLHELAHGVEVEVEEEMDED